MNNCPKCGNPLQPGVTSCPICGNEISSTPNVPNQVTVASVGSPVEKQPVVTESSLVQETNVVTPTVVQTDNEIQASIPVTNTPPTPVVVTTEQPTPQPAEPVSAPIPVQPTTTPVVEQPVQSAETPVVTPAEQPVPTQPQVPVQPAEVPQPQPVQQVSVSQTPVAQEQVAQQAPQPTPAQPQQPSATPTTTKKPKEKKKITINKNVTIIAVSIIVIAIFAGIFIFRNKGSQPINPNNQKQNALTDNTVTSNGYKFTIAEGWIVTEGNGNVVLSSTDGSDTAQMKLSHSIANIEDISEELINNYVKTNELIKESEIEHTEISQKETYILKSKIHDLPTETFFIGGGSRLLIGVTVVYSSDSAKEKFASAVHEMVETLSYADDSLKAINVIDMYRDAFAVYGATITYSQTPIMDEPSNNESNENNNEENENNPNEGNENNNENQVEPSNGHQP